MLCLLSFTEWNREFSRKCRFVVRLGALLLHFQAGLCTPTANIFVAIYLWLLQRGVSDRMVCNQNRSLLLFALAELCAYYY